MAAAVVAVRAGRERALVTASARGRPRRKPTGRSVVPVATARPATGPLLPRGSGRGVAETETGVVRGVRQTGRGRLSVGRRAVRVLGMRPRVRGQRTSRRSRGRPDDGGVASRPGCQPCGDSGPANRGTGHRQPTRT